MPEAKRIRVIFLDADTGATVGSLIGHLAGFLSIYPFLAFLLAEAAIATGFARRASRALADVEDRSADLETLACLLARIESEPFSSPRLRELRACLIADGRPASARIARLAGLVRWLEARHHVSGPRDHQAQEEAKSAAQNAEQTAAADDRADPEVV